MFGLSDYLYVMKSIIGPREVPLKDWDTEPKSCPRESDTSWLCFYSKKVDTKLPHITPRTGNVYKFYIPQKAISPNPTETSSLLERIAESAHRTIETNGIKDKNLNLLGVSLGNAIPYYLAYNGYLPSRIVSVVPGSNLPLSIMKSIATLKVQKAINLAASHDENAFSSYYATLSRFSPANLIGKITDQTKIDVHLGTHDLMIPSEEGEKFVQALKIQGINPKIKRYWPFGHIQTIKKFARTWQEKDTTKNPAYAISK
jgi:hypothetical protein